MATVRLSTLCENTVEKFGIMGEWGLSILVEYGDEVVLFDTGLGNSAVHNAQMMGIDLGGISTMVYSHGHGDHTGGSRDMLRAIGHKVDIHAHPDVWQNKYAIGSPISPDDRNFIGIPFRREDLECLGAVFHYSKEPVRLSEHITTTGEIPMLTDYESIDKNLFVSTENGYEPDALLDDQALAIDTPEGLVMVLGCSHRGIINTLVQARKITGKDKIKAVVGGTHLMRAEADQLSQTLARLEQMGVEKIGVSHCTGMHTAALMHEHFKDKFFFNNAGTVVEL